MNFPAPSACFPLPFLFSSGPRRFVYFGPVVVRGRDIVESKARVMTIILFLSAGYNGEKIWKVKKMLA